MKLTVDASVFVSALQRSDPRYTEAVAFLAAVEAGEHVLLCPTFVLVEVECAIARATGDPVRARRAGESIRNTAGLVLEPLAEELANFSARTGAGLKLRAGDALYVSLAKLFGATLVTYDKEMRTRNGKPMPVLTPEEWLREHDAP